MQMVGKSREAGLAGIDVREPIRRLATRQRQDRLHIESEREDSFLGISSKSESRFDFAKSVELLGLLLDLIFECPRPNLS
jgi:hypothetical protein